MNSVIQGSAADIIKVAMIRCHERLAKEFPASRLVLQVHDELVFEAPEADAHAVRDAMVAEMTGAYPMDPPLRVDAGSRAADWLAAKYGLSRLCRLLFPRGCVYYPAREP